MNDGGAAGPGYLLDASALLALIFAEQGADRIEEIWNDTSISAINLSEAVAKMGDRNLSPERIDLILRLVDGTVIIPFDRPIAIAAGRLREATKPFGLSLADRGCLATAQATGRIAVTADRAWRELDLGIAIEVIR